MKPSIAQHAEGCHVCATGALCKVGSEICAVAVIPTIAQLVESARPEARNCIANVLHFATGRVPDPGLVDALLRAAQEPLTKLLDDRDEQLNINEER